MAGSGSSLMAACDKCGAKKNHFPGCPRYSGRKSGRPPRGEKGGRPYVKPKLRTCGWCGGTGTNAKGRTCIRCGGSGEVENI